MYRQSQSGVTGGSPQNRGSGASSPKGSRSSGSGASVVRRPSGRRTGSSGGGLLRFYTDDSPGLKVGPTVVLVMSLLLIAFVVLLHIWGKFRR